MSTDFKISARTDSGVSSIMRALLLSISLCAQTSGKIAAASSGMTKSRPWRYAYAFAIRQTASAPRGLTPSATCGWILVFSTSVVT